MPVAGNSYVAFVMSDGDNLAYLQHDFATQPTLFASPYRGAFKMTWDMALPSPTLIHSA